MANSGEDRLEHRDEYLNAMRLAAQGQWDQAAAVARPLADQGDAVARVLTAQYLLNAGNLVEGKPYALEAAKAGNGQIAQAYFGNLFGQPENRTEAIEFLKLALDAGYPMDPLGNAPALVQEGHDDAAIEMLRIAASSQPPGARASWEELLARAEQDEARLKAAADEVQQERVRAMEAIRSSEEAIGEDKERVKRLVDETTGLVHGASAETLAREYGSHADEEERRAEFFTRASIAGGLLAAIGTAAIAYFAFTAEEGVGAVLTKAALTIPLVLFAGYLARLAGQFRKKAWAYRHVELQIRTSEPFVSLLDDRPRKLILAALALRFFPGQSQAPDASAPTEFGDPAELLGGLFGLPTPSTTPRRGDAEQTRDAEGEG
jgi:hypothetical protein